MVRRICSRGFKVFSFGLSFGVGHPFHFEQVEGVLHFVHAFTQVVEACTGAEAVVNGFHTFIADPVFIGSGNKVFEQVES
jgi:hypothetical protein